MIKNPSKNLIVESDTLTLKTKDYQITNYSSEVIDIFISNKDVLSLLLNSSNLHIRFMLKQKEVIAKGHFIFDSSIPSGCEYFFPINSEEKPLIYNGVLNIKKNKI